MSKLKDVASFVRSKFKAGRNLIVIVPHHQFMMDLANDLQQDLDCVRMLRRGSAIQVTYRVHSVKILVTGDETHLVCRVKEQCLGHRDQDIIIMDSKAMSLRMRYELECLARVFEAEFSVVAV